MSEAPSIWTSWVCPTCDREWSGDRPHSHLCPDGTLYVSPSTLSAKQSCDTQAWLKAMGASTGQESIPAKAGNVWHQSLAHFFKTRDAQASRDLFETYYRPYADVYVDPNGPIARLTWENLDPIVERWLASYRLDEDYVLYTTKEDNPVLRVHPELVEIPFLLPLNADADIILIGILDLLPEEYHSGHWLVTDHKSTGRIDKSWASKFRLDAQCSSYVWAGRQQTQKPVQGVLINAVEFALLPSDLGRKCATHKVPYAECRTQHARMELLEFSRSDEALEAWRREAIRAANELRHLLLAYPELDNAKLLRIQGQFNGTCAEWGGCFASAYCAGDRLEPINEVFVLGDGMVAKA